MSNKLIDILDDKGKIDSMNENYHYRQSILPRLNKLYKLISHITPRHTHDLEFVDDLIADLKETPHHRVTTLEMKECNILWKKYK